MEKKLIIRPVNRKIASEFCLLHPHARSLPNSSKYYMMGYVNGKPMGLAVWGWGVQPRGTINKLFGLKDTRLYLELNRFFMIEGTPKFYESKFLSLSQKILFNNLPKLKFVFTYSAGFQGLIGTIYKACNYDYIGKQKTSGLHLIKGLGLVHDLSIYHRYGKGGSPLTILKRHYPDAVTLYGYNFSYIKFRNDKTKEEMMKYAKFKILPYPDESEIKIWDNEGKIYTKAEAGSLPVISLKTSLSH